MVTIITESIQKMDQQLQKNIIKVITGEAAAEDIAALSKWLEASSKNRTDFNRIKSYWDSRISTPAVPDAEESFRRMIEKNKKAKNPKTGKSIRIPLLTLAAMAAAFVVVLVTALNLTHENFSFVTGASITNLTLPDGTRLTLNKNSRISYSDDFGRRKREVTLQGEAYFDVAKDRSREFIVNMDDTKVTVLGTSFNARNREEEKAVVITLSEGSVSFSTPDQNIVLSPDQQVNYDKHLGQLDIAAVNAAVASAWKDNIIRIDSGTLRELTAMLEEHFGVRIVFRGNVPAAEKVITAAFDGNYSINQIFDLLRENAAFKWRKVDEDTFEIYK